jgi:hypothetical protein
VAFKHWPFKLYQCLAKFGNIQNMKVKKILSTICGNVWRLFENNFFAIFLIKKTWHLHQNILLPKYFSPGKKKSPTLLLLLLLWLLQAFLCPGARINGE